MSSAAAPLAVVVARVLLVSWPPLAAWGGLALGFQTRGGAWSKWPTVGLWSGYAIVCWALVLEGRVLVGGAAMVAGFAGLALWWHRLAPRNDRDWADDVARITTGTVDGDRVTLHDVRNFDWRTQTDYTQRWETRRYDLRRLQGVDMILSYWSRRAIAHVLISFGFDDGQHVAFSVEIRRERQESFSEIGGFFKAFELCILAADESDVVRTRTNVRGEDDYLYRLRMPVPMMRSLFLAYVGHANALAAEPRFYNTLTVNCTTLVYHMMSRIVGHLPFDYRILLSGYLPGYVYRVGGLDMRYTLAELTAFGRITERARRADKGERFSEAIRAGIP